MRDSNGTQVNTIWNRWSSMPLTSGSQNLPNLKGKNRTRKKVKELHWIAMSCVFMFDVEGVRSIHTAGQRHLHHTLIHTCAIHTKRQRHIQTHSKR